MKQWLEFSSETQDEGHSLKVFIGDRVGIRVGESSLWCVLSFDEAKAVCRHIIDVIQKQEKEWKL